MSEIHTEEQQVEDIKRWWAENGKSVIAGAVLGLALVGGWRGWQQYGQQQAEQASEQYQQFSEVAATGDLEGAGSRSSELRAAHDGTVYASFAALELAKLKYEQGDVDGAKLQLNQVIAKAKEASLKQLARLRLARVLLDGGDDQGAEQLIGSAAMDAFAGEFASLRGDIARQRGNLEDARAAYAEALLLGVADRQLLEMKLSAVGGG